MSTSPSDSLNEIKNTPHIDVEPIIIEDEPKLKIRLLPKKEKTKTTLDDTNQKKSKILLEDTNTITSVFNSSEEYETIPQIIDGINNTPHVNVEPIVIEDEPKLKIRLLPKREKKKTILDDQNEKKGKILSQGLAQDANTITRVFNSSEKYETIPQIIQGINNATHVNEEPIVIEDEPKLKIRLLPKNEKRKTMTPNETTQKKSKILLEGSAQEANTITESNSSNKGDCISQIIDDEPKIKINLLSSEIDRKTISHSEAIST